MPADSDVRATSGRPGDDDAVYSDLGPAPRSPKPFLPFGWPLFAMFGGFPIWWILGVSQFACLIFAVPMAAHLIRQRHIRTPPRFGIWLLFLVWVVGGVLVLQVHAPGTVGADSATRYMTFGYRLLWYLAATVVLLYVGNTRKQLSNYRVSLAMSYMFVVVTAGGLLGLLAPQLEFRSLLELILPSGVTNNGFVYSQIHPVAAQVQSVLGYEEARPSAPFAYTNVWGLNLACSLPFFLVTWCRRDSGWRRVAAPLILVLATVPVIYSLNRGLWLALIAVSVFVAVRYALIGRTKMLFVLLVAALLVSVAIAASPLGDLVQARLAHQHSNEGRTNLGTLTTASVIDGSPVIGYGSTRDVHGNFSSIAAGASPNCPGCSPPPLGTQGQLWLVLFSQGLGGILLYLGFFINQLVRNLGSRSRYIMVGSSVLVVSFVTLPVYDAVGPALITIMVAAAMLWRGGDDDSGSPDATPRARRRVYSGPSLRLSTYLGLLRRHAVVLAVATLVGGTAGGLYQHLRGEPTTASQSIVLGPEKERPLVTRSPATIDTDAKLVTSDPVLEAVATAVGPQLTTAEVAEHIGVTATINTRILHIAFTDADPNSAKRGVEAASAAYLQLLSDRDSRSQHADIEALNKRSEDLAEQLSLTRRVTDSIGVITNQRLRDTMSRLGDEATATSDAALQLSSQPADTARILGEPKVRQSHDRMVVSVASGSVVALTLALMLGWGWERSTRLRRRRTITPLTGLPVLASLSAVHGSDEMLHEVARVRRTLDAHSPVSTVLAVPGSGTARTVAGMLDERVARPPGTGNGPCAVIVALPTTRVGAVNHLQSSLHRCGHRVLGIILMEAR